MPNQRPKPVHVGSAWRLILRDLGLDETVIFRRAGLSPRLLDGAGSHISIESFYALYGAIEAESGDSSIALKVGNIVSIELFDPALFAALCSPDMNTASTRLGQFKRLVGSFSLDVDIGADTTTIGYRCKHRPDIPMLLGLGELVFLVAFMRRATRHEIKPLRITVQRLPEAADAYAEFFGTPLQSGSAYTITLAAKDASRPFLTHNVRMWEAFEPTLRRRMDEAGEQALLSQRVQEALFELLPSGRTQLKDVAKELGIGTRTLQRRLAAEGTTWLAILNHTRERLARHYLLTSNMSPVEVSFLLGFEDPNSLFRAFQRWTGTTPESWRADAKTTG